MAYRRKQGVGITRGTTFKEEIYNQNQNHDELFDDNKRGEDGSLAARAMKASAAHRDSSAYGYAYASSSSDPSTSSSYTSSSSSASFRSYSFPHKGFNNEEEEEEEMLSSSKYGLWGILANKARSILPEDDYNSPADRRIPIIHHQTSYQSQSQSSDNPKLRTRLDAFTSSINQFGNAFEEGRTIVEHKTADIIQETTRKIQIRRRGPLTDNNQDHPTVLHNTSWQRPPVIPPLHTNSALAIANQQTQLKASRDVAMATAAKAKLLLRELKTVKADLAFAKERCAQLEEENKRLRENREKGDNPADDDLIRLQLETLLAEKARLAHENSIYARENRFLREIVEYHQLTMQDVVYLDEGAEEVTEVYPFSIGDARVFSGPTSPRSPNFFPEVYSPLGLHMEVNTEIEKDVCNTTTSKLSQPERKESTQVTTSASSERTEETEP